MKRWAGWIVCACAPALCGAQPAQVSYEGGLLTIHCSEVPLAQVFEAIKSATAMELIVEDSVQRTRLTASIEAEPVSLAIERLLEGSGLNYAMFYDPQDWRRVARIFIGEGGESAAASGQASGPGTTAPRRGPVRRAPADEGIADEGEIPPENEYVEEEPAPPEETTEPVEAQEPPPESPAGNKGQNFLPPPQSFPRSSFTPGPESSPFGSGSPRQGGTSTGTTNQGTNETPPAYYPFLDPFGRPIPVPTEMTQEQQQQEQQKQQKPKKQD